MDKKQIAATLRQEVGELEAAINKCTTRCERLKRLVLDLEAEVEAADGGRKKAMLVDDSKFRRAIDAVFGEPPKSKRK